MRDDGAGHRLLSRRTALAASLGAGAGLMIRRARAQEAAKLSLGYTATLGFNGAFIAKDRGLFAKHGLDVDLVLIGLNSNIPAALVGGSIQIGGPTPPVLMQANDGGLDLVIVGNASVLDPENHKDGVMARAGSGIAKPADFAGKKVGVPGLNAFLHVIFRRWLLDNTVDPNRVNFIEVAFSQSADVLKSGSVDAVITGEPFSTRIVAEGIGSLAVPLAAQAPAGVPAIFYGATRAWAGAHPDQVHTFRAALAEAVAFQDSDPAAARLSASKFIRFPADVLASMTLPKLATEVTQAQLRWWVDAMTQQKMLQEQPDITTLVAS